MIQWNLFIVVIKKIGATKNIVALCFLLKICTDYKFFAIINPENKKF